MTGTDRAAWTEPGAHQVAPGVHRVPLPLPNDGLRAVNVYVLQAGDGLVLVDAGWDLPESRAQLSAALAELGASLDDVTRFLVTHVHRDHYTQAVAVRRELADRGRRVQVGLGAGERPTLDLLHEPDRSPLLAQLEQLRLHGADALADQLGEQMQGHRVDPEAWALPDEWLEEGPLPLPGGRVLQAVPTPGHTRGHLVFADDDAGLLFAGDHVLPTITPSIGFEPALTPDPLGAFLRSLALVRSRPDALLLPAHGPTAPSVHARVDELVAHHGARLDQAEAAALGQGLTTLEVAERLRWTKREHRYADLDPFNAMLAVFETGAHLDLLVAQGRLLREQDGGVRRYR